MVRAPEEMVCNRYSMFTKMKTVATKREFTRHLINALEESLVECNYKRPVVICPNCGHVQLPDDGKLPLPYSPAPECQYSSDFVSQIGMLVTTGLPINRTFTYHAVNDEDKQISTVELNRAVMRFATGDGAVAQLVMAHDMDTNEAERAIRAVTLYKHSAFFKQTREGLEGYCNYMSLRETAAMNGIAHPTRWVREFSRAFLLHCIEHDLTERAKSAKIDDATQLRTGIHRFSQKALESFDFTPWLAWNYARSLKAEDRTTPVR